MMKAQIPLEIKAFAAKYDLETFQLAMNAAYGYVTYLQSVKEALYSQTIKQALSREVY
jgi:hypothetical protein